MRASRRGGEGSVRRTRLRLQVAWRGGTGEGTEREMGGRRQEGREGGKGEGGGRWLGWNPEA